MSKVISRKNLPVHLPLQTTVIAYLLLDKFHAAGWIYGMIGTLLVIIWISAIVTISKEEKVDMFKESNLLSKWAQKMKDIQNLNK